MNYCIVGAGAAGLAMGKRLKENRIPFEILEKASDVGGVWDYTLHDSPVYQSTRLISSKPLTEFADYPMPREYEDYPGHQKVWRYFRDFARDHDLNRWIRFQTRVQKAERTEDGKWRIVMESGETRVSRVYDGLISAGGFTNLPNYPQISGKFSGETLHSKFYKSPDIFKGKRVLVIGAGNSGCDIACEATQTAKKVFLSTRRGYHFIPKYFFGIPSDQFGELALRLRVPMSIRQWMNQLLIRAVMGKSEKVGFQKPDHKILESHPIINSEILKLAQQGHLIPKVDVSELDGNQVRFKDGSTEEIDLILYATGYLPEIPYLESQYLNWQKDHAEFYLHIFHPEFDNFFVLGMVQPDSGTWGIFDEQARAVSAFIRAQLESPSAASKFREKKADLSEDRKLRGKYLPSLRHHFEVEHSYYMRRLRSVTRELSIHNFKS